MEKLQSATFSDGNQQQLHITNSTVLVGQQTVGSLSSGSGSSQQNDGAHVSGADGLSSGHKLMFGDIYVNDNHTPIRDGTRVFQGCQIHATGQKKDVAIKMIAPYDKKNLREVNHLVTLTPHSNVVEIIRSEKFDGRACPELYIVMELCRKDTLRDYCKKTPFDFDQVMSYCRQLLEGIRHIHENKIIHGDLKPENILFSLDGKFVKVADFGISKQLEVGKSMTRRTSEGTDCYRAPETFNSDSISQHADIYSLAIIIYGMFTNDKHPFGRSKHKQLCNMLENEGLDLSQIPDEIGASKKVQLQMLLGRMLHFDPKKRPSINQVSGDVFFASKCVPSTTAIVAKKEEPVEQKQETQDAGNSESISCEEMGQTGDTIPSDDVLTADQISAASKLSTDFRIPPEGDKFHESGCMIKFPRRRDDEISKFTVSNFVDPGAAPPGYIYASSVIACTPPFESNEVAVVTIKSWFLGYEKAAIFTKDAEGNWMKNEDAIIDRAGYIHLCSHSFDKFAAFLSINRMWLTLFKVLAFSSTDGQGNFAVGVCLDDRAMRSILKERMRRRHPHMMRQISQLTVLVRDSICFRILCGERTEFSGEFEFTEDFLSNLQGFITYVQLDKQYADARCEITRRPEHVPESAEQHVVEEGSSQASGSAKSVTDSVHASMQEAIGSGDQEPSTSGASIPKFEQLQGIIQDPQEEGATGGDQKPSTSGESIPEAEQMWSKIEEPQAAEATGGDQEPSTSGASIPKFEQLRGIIQDPQEEGATGGEPSTSAESIPKTEQMLRKTLDEMPHGIVVTEGNESEESSQEIDTIHEFDMLRQQRVQPSSAMDKGYRDFLENSFHAACLTTAYKKATITPQGGSISLYGCELIFSEGEIDKDEVFELSVDNNPNLYPKSVMPVSLIIGCKPSKFRKRVKVRLASWFRSEDGRDIKVIVFSRSASKRDWEAIREANLTKSGFIEFEVLHFCKYVAAVPHNGAEKGLIHYHNDVQMHLTRGYVMSYLCHDQKSIDQWKKELASCFRRIVALPPEMLIPINGSIDMSISCVLPQEMEMESDTCFPFTFVKEEAKITKRNFYFEPKPHPSEINHTGRYDLKYVVEVKDSQGIRVENASHSIPLDYEWQGTASFSGQASVTGQHLSEDQHSNTPSNEMSLRSSQTSTAKEATAEALAFKFDGNGKTEVNIKDGVTVESKTNCQNTSISVAINLPSGSAQNQNVVEAQAAAKPPPAETAEQPEVHIRRRKEQRKPEERGEAERKTHVKRVEKKGIGALHITLFVLILICICIIAYFK